VARPFTTLISRGSQILHINFRYDRKLLTIKTVLDSKAGRLGIATATRLDRFDNSCEDCIRDLKPYFSSDSAVRRARMDSLLFFT
jgi:hypothetical protein